MPKPIYRHSSPSSASSNRWRDELRRSPYKLSQYAAAVAGLGSIGILDERDANEHMHLDDSNRLVFPWNTSWKQCFEEGDLEALRSLFDAQRAAIDECPFPTAEIRSQVLDVFSTWDNHSPLAMAAGQLLKAWMEEPSASFESIFRHHWTEVSIALESDREAGNYECQEEFRWMLNELTQIQPGQRVLLIQSTGTAFLMELLERLKALGLENSISVECQSVPEELFAMATMLSQGVIDPTIRFAEVEDGPTSEQYDWITSLPRFGVRTDVPEWCPVIQSIDRGESITLQRAALSLAVGGRCLALMPRTFSTAQDSPIRRWLLNNYRVDALIEVPSRGAYSGLGIATSVVCFRREAKSSEAFILGERLYSERLREPGVSIRPDAHQTVILAPVLKQFGLNVDTTKLEHDPNRGCNVCSVKGFVLALHVPSGAAV